MAFLAQNLLKFLANAESVAVVDQSKLSEFRHKVAYAWPGCADPLGQGLLTDLRKVAPGHFIRSSAGQQEKHADKTLFTGMKEPVGQTFLGTDLLHEEILCEETS